MFVLSKWRPSNRKVGRFRVSTFVERHLAIIEFGTKWWKCKEYCSWQMTNFHGNLKESSCTLSLQYNCICFQFYICMRSVLNFVSESLSKWFNGLGRHRERSLGAAMFCQNWKKTWDLWQKWKRDISSKGSLTKCSTLSVALWSMSMWQSLFCQMSHSHLVSQES